MTPIHHKEIWTAYLHWMEVSDGAQDWLDFCKFIGVGEWHLSGTIPAMYAVPEEVARKIELLNSSHYRTLIKMIEAQEASTETK